MGATVCMGATLKCSFGLAPSTYIVLPIHQVMAATPAGNITDCVPLVNIMPFGACTSLSNPTVAAATAAALGVLTPMPCIPVPAGTWLPGAPTVTLKGPPALDQSSKLMCSWGGIIEVINPGQFKVSDA